MCFNIGHTYKVIDHPKNIDHTIYDSVSENCNNISSILVTQGMSVLFKNTRYFIDFKPALRVIAYT